ncbi:ribonuclease III [Dokdonella sp.]|uniref:ribonuclease III n=1 Tax=Dokdonella sp. TaxID=2291710 RepID=UPI0025C5CB3F|nr:ribonuclease III [Dokdonella sp.]
MTESGTLGHRFADVALLERALTHRSAAHVNNERLEFLGDALLNLLVAELIFELHPRASEGEMTRLRAALVNGNALADMARGQQLGDQLHLGPGELKSGGHRRDSILADAFEALVAAVYLDGGWQACRQRVRDLFAPLVEAGARTPKDAKTRLQELLQARGLPLPVYDLLATAGEEHARVFTVSCRVEAIDAQREGSGSSRRAAEQIAAERVLEFLEAGKNNGH